MEVKETELAGILLLKPRQFTDTRGMFMETYNTRTMEQLGLPTEWPQDNFSLSMKGVVRGTALPDHTAARKACACALR